MKYYISKISGFHSSVSKYSDLLGYGVMSHE
jgi:hypothetical protein